MWRLLLLLCGCNQVLGLSETIAIDAQKFDAPPRLPPRCPALGETIAFSPVLHQLHFDCNHYVASTDVDLAVASCRSGDFFQPHIGPREGPFAPIAELPVSTVDLDVSSPRLDPEGTQLLISTFDFTNIQGALLVYHRSGDQWVRDADVVNPPPRTSNPSRGPDHRMLGTNGISDVIELSDASGSWQPIRMHALATLGVPSVGAIWLSQDALRMVFVANAFDAPDRRSMAYADRATVDDPFGPATPLGLPVVEDAFITEDCGRLYFSGLHSIFYAESP